MVCLAPVARGPDYTAKQKAGPPMKKARPQEFRGKLSGKAQPLSMSTTAARSSTSSLFVAAIFDLAKSSMAWPVMTS